MRASVPKGELTARAAKEDKNDTEMPSPKMQKIDGTNYKIDATRTLRRCSKKLEAPWRDTHNADPGGKKERMLTELTELTVTKNTLDLRSEVCAKFFLSGRLSFAQLWCVVTRVQKTTAE
jgi:hypothetical protein